MLFIVQHSFLRSGTKHGREIYGWLRHHALSGWLASTMQWSKSNVIDSHANALSADIKKDQNASVSCPHTSDRFLYNLLSALTLHLFLHCYVDCFGVDETKVLLTLPITPAQHLLFSVIVSAIAFAALLTQRKCCNALMLGWQHQGKNAVETQMMTGVTGRCPISRASMATMDVITLMAHTTYQRFGPFGFLLFTGIAIVPRRMSLGDILVRVFAALYLRLRSRHFVKFSIEVEQWHLLNWAVRALIVIVSMYFGAHCAIQHSAEDALSVFTNFVNPDTTWNQALMIYLDPHHASILGGGASVMLLLRATEKALK